MTLADAVIVGGLVGGLSGFAAGCLLAFGWGYWNGHRHGRNEVVCELEELLLTDEQCRTGGAL